MITPHFTYAPTLVAALMLTAGGLRADEFDEYRKEQQAAFEAYQKERQADVAEEQRAFEEYVAAGEAEFERYQAQWQKEFEEFRSRITDTWGEFREPSNTRWVEYDPEGESVAEVDFEKGEVRVEVQAPPDAKPAQVKKKVSRTVQRVLTSRGSATAAPVATKTEEQTVLDKPVLAGQVVDEQGKKVTPALTEFFARDVAAQARPRETTTASGKKVHTVVLTFKLTPDHIKKRMKPFLGIVKKYCAKYALDPAHILATIHTESYFNPMARSHCNAIGLMQLVPTSGGREAYRFVRGTDAIPKVKYLYEPENNIELGCAYTHLLQKRHFGDVVDPQRKTYCSIAGYNTGPGNVARAFVGKRNVSAAIKVINGMNNAEKVYDTMVARLPYAETRDYLPKVVDRMKLYR